MVPERKLIVSFVSHLGHAKGRPELKVGRWPEDDNRQRPEVDAIAGPFAIEHTSIDSVENQRRADDWFLRVVGGLRPVIVDCVDCGFSVSLKFDAIKKGADWKAIRAELENWIRANAADLALGTHEITLPSISFFVLKGGPKSISGFQRFAPSDNTLVERARSLLDRKAKKLKQYQNAGNTTVLLVESEDIALMNSIKMLDAIKTAYPEGLPQGVDELWFAHTFIENEAQFVDFTVHFRGKGCLASSLGFGGRQDL